jgi:tight adherence protein C
MDFLPNFMTGLTERFGPMAPLLAVGLLGMLLILWPCRW